MKVVIGIDVGGSTTKIVGFRIDENGKKTTITTPVFVGGEPVILGEIYPAVTGVVVLCSCSDQLTVRLSVLDVVTTMLGISCDKVRILTQ